MPSRNLVRHFDAPAYYHVYNRGAGKQKIFLDSHDKQKFISILERHILPDQKESEEIYPKYDIEVTAYCLMGNHFHLLLYQEEDPEAYSNLMKSVGTAYTMYFNRRYKSSGRLFQGPFRASHVQDEAYLAHISRYIHLNPRSYKTYYWSSLKFYMNQASSDLVNPWRITDATPEKYMSFLKEYESRRAELKKLYSELEM